MPKLMADRMLKGLALRLRLIGYDCADAPQEVRSAVAVLKAARAEGRLLVTSKRQWLDLKRDDDLIIVPPEGLAKQVKAVIAREPIDFERDAFSRCSIDNTPLASLPFQQIESQLPPLVREMCPAISRCPQCHRLYWRGTHTARIWRELMLWCKEVAQPCKDDYL